jgi:site-specific DNA recombinase
MAFEMFRDLWAAKLETIEQDRSSIKRQLDQTDRKFQQLIDRLVDTDNQTLKGAYETRLKEIEEQKVFLAEKLAETGQPRTPFREAYRTAFDFLANPWNLWQSDRLEDKRSVLKLVFADRLAYVRNQGYRTTKSALPFKALGGLFDAKSEMAIPEGLEPSTC